MSFNRLSSVTMFIKLDVDKVTKGVNFTLQQLSISGEGKDIEFKVLEHTEGQMGGMFIH